MPLLVIYFKLTNLNNSKLLNNINKCIQRFNLLIFFIILNMDPKVIGTEAVPEESIDKIEDSTQTGSNFQKGVKTPKIAIEEPDKINSIQREDLENPFQEKEIKNDSKIIKDLLNNFATNGYIFDEDQKLKEIFMKSMRRYMQDPFYYYSSNENKVYNQVKEVSNLKVPRWVANTKIDQLKSSIEFQPKNWKWNKELQNINKRF